jgi:hypothetical protein
MTRHRKPAWWQLCALVPPMGSLLFFVYLAALPPWWREGAHVGITILISCLVWRWLRANAYMPMAGPMLSHGHKDNRGDSQNEGAYDDGEAMRPPLSLRRCL